MNFEMAPLYGAGVRLSGRTPQRWRVRRPRIIAAHTAPAFFVGINDPLGGNPTGYGLQPRNLQSVRRLGETETRRR